MRVRVRALGRRAQVHPFGPLAAVLRQELCQLVVVVRAALFNIEVYAVQHGSAEGPGGPGSAEIVVPEVVCDGLGIGGGGEGVAAGGAAEGEEDLDVLGLAGVDVGGEGGAGAGGGVAVAGEVENRGLVVAEGGEEGEDDEGLVAGGAGGCEGALIAVLAPVDGDFAGKGGGEGGG